MAFSRPVIGVNLDFVSTAKTGTAITRLGAGYFDKIYEADGLPLALPPIPREEAVESLLDRIDGLVLSGGADIDPKRHNLPSHSAVVPMSARREEFDFLLLRLAMKRKIPILGIGVGMQQINVARGGSLYLHIPEDLPKAMPHYDPSGGPHRHIVLLEPGTRMDAIYGGGELRVNSSHHQAIKKLGQGLRLGAKSPDDVIEAIEVDDDDWFCIGVQWHPESDTASALDMQLFRAFIEAITGVSPKAMRLAA
jgi:putative glutamine amidotransferase